MLHTRRGPLARGAATAASVTLALWDHIGAIDPGLIRLMLAVRGTTSVLLATLAAMLAGHLWGVSVVECASGITFSLMGPFLMREPTPRQRQRTLLVLVLPAIGATIATSLLHGLGVIGDSSFLALVFIFYLLHPISPRLIAIGLVSVVITYVGLYLELPPATLPVQIASVIAALPLIAFACFVVVPMNAPATLRRMVAAVQARAAHVLHSAHDVAASGGIPGLAVTKLRRDLARLNEAALAADDQLALLAPAGREAVRAGLIDLELATARLVEVLRDEQDRPRHSIRLLLHERRMRRGRRYNMTPDMLEPGTLRGRLVELGHAVHRLGEAARGIAPATSAPVPAKLPPGPLAWRLATRVTLAAALAMAGGMAISPQRWFWAVITVYVVFLNARTRGDAVYRGLQRLGGTVLGIVIGLILAALLEGDPWVAAAALLGSVFGMYYWIMTSYTVGIFCVTVLLSLLYGLLGVPLESLMLLRLEETAIGAAAAIFVAACVLPTPTRDQVIRSGRGVLAALVGAVRASRQALAGGEFATPPMQAMRLVDRQVADLRLALAPLTAGRVLLRRSALERPVPALLDCVHWTRALAAASQATGAGPAAGTEALAARAAAIESRLAGLAGVPTGEAGALAAPDAAPAGEADEARAALDRLEAAVATLAERLEIGALEGFAVDA
jgi:uncharacterized membrane protein YccC